MTGDGDWVPDTPEGVAALMDGLTFDFDREVPESQLPPVLAEGEDIKVTRSFKIPAGLDFDLQRIADRVGVSKSELIRRYLSAAVIADRAAQGEQVMIPLSAALQALTGLQHGPNAA